MLMENLFPLPYTEQHLHIRAARAHAWPPDAKDNNTIYTYYT